MFRKALMALGATIVLGATGAALTPTDAAAQGRHFGGGGFHRGGFGGGFHRGGFGGGFHRGGFGGGFHRGHFGGGFHRVHFGGPRYFGGGYGFGRPYYRPFYRPIVYRPFYRPYYRPFIRYAAFAPAYGFVRPAYFGPSCVIKKRIRFTRWGEPVRVIKRICY